MRKIPQKLLQEVEKNVKSLLHASRDCLRNQDQDTAKVSFSVHDGYYGEAFGIMRALQIQNYGYWGASNYGALEDTLFRKSSAVQNEQNLKWWFDKLEKEVLEEEGFYKKGTYEPGNHQCDYCFTKWHKDSVRKR